MNQNNDADKDSLFARDFPPVKFVFDEDVAKVFADMINRSVPGYSTIISMIAVLADRYCQQNSVIYDLGCSLGAATVAMQQTIDGKIYKIIAVDNSSAMTSGFSRYLDGHPELAAVTELRCENILQTSINNASVVVLNFTLQFIPVEHRIRLLKSIYDGMNPGGILILSEKIQFPDKVLNELFIEMYHRFKETMGYSKLEISQKRSALENVLIPEPIETHRDRLKQVGFSTTDVWFQCFNFASLVAFK